MRRRANDDGREISTDVISIRVAAFAAGVLDPTKWWQEKYSATKRVKIKFLGRLFFPLSNFYPPPKKRNFFQR